MVNRVSQLLCIPLPLKPLLRQYWRCTLYAEEDHKLFLSLELAVSAPSCIPEGISLVITHSYQQPVQLTSKASHSSTVQILLWPLTRCCLLLCFCRSALLNIHGILRWPLTRCCLLLWFCRSAVLKIHGAVQAAAISGLLRQGRTLWARLSLSSMPAPQLSATDKWWGSNTTAVVTGGERVS